MSEESSAGFQPTTRSRERQEFEELLIPLLEPGFGLAMMMLSDRPQAEDALQEAALKLWRQWDRLRTDANPRPWFLAIVANQCRTVRRSRWWHVLKSADLNFARTESFDDWSNDRVDLKAGLDRLPQRHLLPLALYYHLDLPIDEVAQVLRCSSSAARQRIHRALEALRAGVRMETDE